MAMAMAMGMDMDIPTIKKVNKNLIVRKYRVTLLLNIYNDRDLNIF